MSAARVGFGTSTFVAGRLLPDKESGPGIATLAEAIQTGVRVIHSNPNLGTQWAIRRALNMVPHVPTIRHLVKIEVPLGVSRARRQQVISNGLATSLRELAVSRVDGVVLELDLKRTLNRRLLTDLPTITAFYQDAAESLLATGLTASVLGYCHSPAHLLACLRAEPVVGCAAQYNLIEAWPAVYLDRVAAAGRTFVGMAPLRRGALVDRQATTPEDRLRALRWVLGHPVVSCAIVTMSTPAHLREVLRAAGRPSPIRDVQRYAATWQAAGRSSSTVALGREAAGVAGVQPHPQES